MDCCNSNAHLDMIILMKEVSNSCNFVNNRHPTYEDEQKRQKSNKQLIFVYVALNPSDLGSSIGRNIKEKHLFCVRHLISRTMQFGLQF